MNVQATKLQLMQLILESKNSDLLHSLLEILKSSPQTGTKRVKLTEEEKEGALEGLDDVKNGRVVDFGTFMKEFE